MKAVPLPSVEILSDMNRCDVPDGAAGAHVGGSTTDHIFAWYTQQGKPITHEVNHIAENLMPGAYYVTATDRKTGCVSEPVSFSIADKTYLPEFTVTVEPALCENEDGKLKIVRNVSDLSVDPVIWYSPLGREIIGRLPEISGLPIGYYPYDIIGSNGCIKNGLAEVGADINVFNGISPNGDGDNDIFEIGCIEDFVNNNVKIFNRAGTLIYEASGYDNQSIFFEGYGNRGVYVGGKELPDGTYFYIIEKKDGTKPRTGYLEIVR
jgi:gliding motility-associated-like protein